MAAPATCKTKPVEAAADVTKASTHAFTASAYRIAGAFAALMHPSASFSTLVGCALTTFFAVAGKAGTSLVTMIEYPFAAVLVFGTMVFAAFEAFACLLLPAVKAVLAVVETVLASILHVIAITAFFAAILKTGANVVNVNI